MLGQSENLTSLRTSNIHSVDRWVLEAFEKAKTARVTGQLVFHLKDGQPFDADMSAKGLRPK